jgi:hypothetical protein
MTGSLSARRWPTACGPGRPIGEITEIPVAGQRESLKALIEL